MGRLTTLEGVGHLFTTSGTGTTVGPWYIAGHDLPLGQLIPLFVSPPFDPSGLGGSLVSLTLCGVTLSFFARSLYSWFHVTGIVNFTGSLPLFVRFGG